MNTHHTTLKFLALLFVSVVPSVLADPLISSWVTNQSGKYARIYTNNANRTAGTSATTWSNGTQNQALPAYCGVQEVAYDASWVYLKTSGLATHVMGPWLNGAFPNLPKNQNSTYKFPRTPQVPGTKTLTGNGTLGFYVDGVAMFDGRDAFYWNGSADATGIGYWNRDAWVNESQTFDGAYAHQEPTGTYHYHANPIAVRYLLGDHVTYNTSTKLYTESTAPVTQHSPILGWARDGHPIYGPYGYSNANDPNSGLRRMVSGYALRNGANGTDTLTNRSTLPAWATRLGYSYATSTTGPAVSATGVLGKYIEDNAYLGDTGRTLGVDFDLDEYNGRTCMTPEYPSGVYAYFTTINAAGTPVFPYTIGRAFHGTPSGTNGTAPVGSTIAVVAGPVAQETMAPPSLNKATGDLTLTWDSVEGGTYKVESSQNLSVWNTLSAATQAATNSVQTSLVDAGTSNVNSRRFYRAIRTALATYDGGGTTGGGGTSVSVPGGTATHGTTVTLTINIPPASTPPVPPANVPVTAVTIGGSAVGVSALVHTSQYVVTCTYAVPATPTGARNVVVTFTTPNGTATYNLTGGLTVN